MSISGPLNNLLKKPITILLACKTILFYHHSVSAVMNKGGHTLGGLAKPSISSCRWNPCMAVPIASRTGQRFWKSAILPCANFQSQRYIKLQQQNLEINTNFIICIYFAQKTIRMCGIKAYNPVNLCDAYHHRQKFSFFKGSRKSTMALI